MASFGENLRRERELRGVDLHEMADATKISFRFLQALEQDRVDVLPGGLFPRAFVRQYAKYLGLDPDRLVAEFVFAHGGGAAAQPTAPPADAARSKVLDGPVIDTRHLAAGVLVLALFAFAAWQVLRPRTGPESVAVAEPTPTPIFATPFPEDRVYPPPTTGGAVAPAGFAITLAARQASWVDVKADGVTVINREMAAGESQRIEARERIVLSSVGNAGGVEYSIEGRGRAMLGRQGEVRRNVVFTPESMRTGAPAVSPAPGLRAAPRPTPRPSPVGEAPSPDASPVAQSPAAPAPDTTATPPPPGVR